MAAVKKIVVEIKGKDIELSMQDAKGLRDALLELFPVTVSPTVIREYPYIPYRPWTVTYGDSTAVIGGGG